MLELLKVIKQDEVQLVPSQKAEGGQTQKCQILLKRFGGKYADEFLVTLLGNDAGLRLYPGDLVVAKLRFSVHEHKGVTYQDIVASDIVKFG